MLQSLTHRALIVKSVIENRYGLLRNKMSLGTSLTAAQDRHLGYNRLIVNTSCVKVLPTMGSNHSLRKTNLTVAGKHRIPVVQLKAFVKIAKPLPSDEFHPKQNVGQATDDGAESSVAYQFQMSATASTAGQVLQQSLQVCVYGSQALLHPTTPE